jgi:hypothetical protein
MNEKQRQWMASNIDVVEMFRAKIEEKIKQGEKVVMTKIAQEVRKSFQDQGPSGAKRSGRTPAWLAGELAREHLARCPETADLFSGHITKDVEEVRAMDPKQRMTAALLELEMRIGEMEAAIKYLENPVKPWYMRIFG